MKNSRQACEARFFNLETRGMLKKLDEAEMLELAREIHARGEIRRARLAASAPGEALPA